MNLTELEHIVAQKAFFPNGITDTASKAKAVSNAKLALKAIMEAIQDALAKGEEIRMIGFGTFLVKTRAARQARNPRTGYVIQVPERKVVAFKPGKSFKDAVHPPEGEEEEKTAKKPASKKKSK